MSHKKSAAQNGPKNQQDIIFIQTMSNENSISFKTATFGGVSIHSSCEVKRERIFKKRTHRESRVKGELFPIQYQ